MLECDILASMASTTQVQKSSHFRLEFDHSEQLTRTASALLIDPVKSVLYYLVPWVGAYISNDLQLRTKDKVQISLLPEKAKEEIIQKIDKLRIAAGLDRSVDVYTSLKHSCSGYGGGYSLTAPIVSIPLPYLTAYNRSIFCNFPFAAPNPSDAHWIFNSDEVSFFIAREIAQIRSNDILLRIAVKTLFITSLFFIWVLPISWIYGSLLFTACVGMYAYSERSVQAVMDVSAVETLAVYFNGNHSRALNAALSALEKLRLQNVERRPQNRFCRYYITNMGNNLLDLDHPFLTTRIQQLKSAIGNRNLPLSLIDSGKQGRSYYLM